MLLNGERWGLVDPLYQLPDDDRQADPSLPKNTKDRSKGGVCMSTDNNPGVAEPDQMTVATQRLGPLHRLFIGLHRKDGSSVERDAVLALLANRFGCFTATGGQKGSCHYLCGCLESVSHGTRKGVIPRTKKGSFRAFLHFVFLVMI
jgi:hypothetical protein